ncbi:MAG: hypothetical protein EWM72_03340 [Nitrospira sp.]|nr:MAG: hypothetical protein EWM72_03340 [Nitrospira sp.]
MDANSDLAFFGELDRVADEVQQHLPQAQGIPDEALGYVRAHVEQQLQPLVMGLEG